MVIKLDFNECLKDSPLFRKNLSKAENDLESFESVYKKINENCISFYNDGIKYLDSYKKLTESIQQLNGLLNEKEEEFTKKKMNNFCSLLKDARQGEEDFLNESFKSITEKLNKFLEFDFRQIKDSRKQFERISNELDTAYLKNADAPKTKPNVCEEMERNLCGIKKTFGHVSLDYVCHLNKFYLIRAHSILDMVI